MATRSTFQTIICLSLFLGSLQAQAFDILKVHCFRHDQSGEQKFLSEIHFQKVAHQIEGEVVSFSIRGQEKKYISGYNLYSISYHDQMISGLTGDPITHSDGSFTLLRTSQKNNGIWKFSYTNTSGINIDADFCCVYSSLND